MTKKEVRLWMIKNSQKEADLFDSAVNHFKAHHNKTMLEYMEFLFYEIEKVNKKFEKQRIPFLIKMVKEK